MDKLGRYEIHAELGRGGMGIVYLARDPSLGRDVALKVLPPERAQDAALVERFLAEAQHAARLNHPNIVQIFDVGQEGDKYYFAMEFVPGSDLAAALEQRGPMSLDEAVALLRPVADALDTAHAQGLIHRDIKPENILIGHDGRPRLVDFGIARAGASRGLTQTGMMMGTPDYLSPEQAEGREIDHRSDLYSLGVVAYRMLTGAPPFRAETPLGVALAHVRERPPAVSSRRGDLGEQVDAVLERALAKLPEQRFDTAADFVASLAGERALPAQTVAVSAVAAPAPTATSARSPMLVLGGVVAATLLGGLGTGLILFGGGHARSAERSAAPPPPVVTEPAPSRGEILWASSQRELTHADVATLDDGQLQLARHEIYARHGRPFSDALVKAYFSALDWYTPDPGYNDTRLSAIESTNLAFLQRVIESRRPQPEPASLPPSGAYVLPQSGSRALTHDDVAGLNAHQLRLARNEIYARHGRPFRDPALQSHFDSQGWYRRNANYHDGLLSATESRNAVFIQQYERD